ncbi:hypothetical protein EYC84_009554 [Monilinia fructicola]|nr:hypothetical protein EYC84_009554 [Monilinia fructicola]
MNSQKGDCWNGLIAKTDTSTAEKWIESSVIERQQFQARRGKPVETNNFNGDVCTSVATVVATWAVEGHNMSHQTEFRVIENGPFDVLFGRNLLSLPAIKYFRDDGIDDTPILLEQSDISPQEQAARERNRAAADALAKKNEQRRRPIPPPRSSHKNLEKVKKSTAHRSRHSPSDDGTMKRWRFGGSIRVEFAVVLPSVFAFLRHILFVGTVDLIWTSP